MELDGQIIPVDNFVSSAKILLGLENTTVFDIILSKWALEGIRHLDCLSLLKKNVGTFPICDNKVKLPNCFVRLLGLKTKSATTVNDVMYVDIPFITAIGFTGSFFNTKDFFEINNGYIIFHGDIPDDITEVVMAYLSFNTDKDGLLVAQSDQERGVTSYVCWKYAQREFAKIPANLRNEWMREYQSQKRWIKSVDFQKAFQNTKSQIREWMNALVVNQNQWNTAYRIPNW